MSFNRAKLYTSTVGLFAVIAFRMSVRLSVRLSQVGVRPKRLNVGLRKNRGTIAHNSCGANDPTKFRSEREMQVRKIKLRFTTGREVSGSDALTSKICVHPPRRSASSRSRRCAGGVIRGVVNHIGGSRRRMITVTVKLSPTRSVVRKSVDDSHGIACSLCDHCTERCMYKTMQVAE